MDGDRQHKVKIVTFLSGNPPFLNRLQNNIQIYFVNMNNSVPILKIKCETWYKDSHSLFDYESKKITEQYYEIPMPLNQIVAFRKKNNSSVKLYTRFEHIDYDIYDFLTFFYIKPSDKPGFFKLEFTDGDYKKTTKKRQRLNTEESNSSHQPRESTYFVVKKFTDAYGNPSGFKLNAGQIVKLGRVEYFVSEVNFKGKTTSAVSKNKTTICNRNIHKYEDQPKNQSGELIACKFCLEEHQADNNFMLSPCKCTGSCGLVHIRCLQEWIHIKVKKEVVGGTKHFNFQKFECEVCKTQFPMIIQKQGKNIQLLPLEKPVGDYLILEAASEKTKSVMLITNIEQAGIKLGRGHECQIRITDISVSRNHALIKRNHDGFYIYDNKSKFGTLVKQQGVYSLEVGPTEKGIQIGRTFMTLEFPPKKLHP